MRDMRPDLPDLQSSSQPVPTLRLLPSFLFLVSVFSRLSPSYPSSLGRVFIQLRNLTSANRFPAALPTPCRTSSIQLCTVQIAMLPVQFVYPQAGALEPSV